MAVGLGYLREAELLVSSCCNFSVQKPWLLGLTQEFPPSVPEPGESNSWIAVQELT